MAVRVLLTALTAAAAAFPLAARAEHTHKYDFTTPVNASLPNVTIFATGGTIASKGNSNTQTVGYDPSSISVGQLLEGVPGLLNVSNIRGYQVSNVDSTNINETILLELSSMINDELTKPEISGVVITHGTDSLEETAFFLDLVVHSSKPVVIVGAMRPATALSADGPLNLYQAVTLATSPNARDRGAMITLNDRIGSAFYTTKNNANSLDTFHAREAGQLGVFINQVPYFYYSAARPIGRRHFNISSVTRLPRVDILFAHQEMDVSLAGAAASAGAQGIVYAGMGAGGWPESAKDVAEGIFNRTGIPFVASHRSGDGFVAATSDNFAIPSGFYNPQKARILLQLALATGSDVDTIKETFALSYPLP